MLQRSEKSAYSWWWASHIRTKQSKWLENNLQEMEETVHSMLKLVETDADSFATRAELYFKRRPELIGFVEDAYRSYRALAERYDRISGELHKANHTIASSCPDQVQYAMLEEDDEMFPRAFTPIDPSRINRTTLEGLVKKRRSSNEEPVRSNRQDKTTASQTDHDDKMQEINKLQRGILVLESEKQFIKSSYESGIAKYWELEKQIMGLHEEIIRRRDDVSTTAVIEENEARTIMIATTLKSCEDVMACIQQQRIESIEQVKLESEMMRISKQKVKALKGERCESKMKYAEVSGASSERSFIAANMEKETDSLSKARIEFKSICEKINEYIVITNPESSVQVAEKVNEYLNMVVSLQLTVSSQADQINRLISDSNELETNLQKLQEEKMDSIEPTVLTEKVKEAEQLLGKLETIVKLVIDEEANFCGNLLQVIHNMNDISDKVSPRKPVEEDACPEHEFVEGEGSTLDTEPLKECKDKEIMEIHDIEEDSAEEILVAQPLVQFVEDILQNKADSPLNNACVNMEKPEKTNTLGEKRSAAHQVEKKKQDYIREMVTLIGELVHTIAIRDEEIQRLRQQLAFLKTRPNGSQVELESEVLADVKSESSSQTSSSVEDSSVHCVEREENKYKRDVDSLLGKNLEFWLRFSTTYRYIEQLKAKYADIQSDISKLEDNKGEEGNDGAAATQAAKPESEPVIKRLRELKGELQVWSEQSMLLRGELQRRFLFLNNIKEEMSSVVNTSSAAAGEPVFSADQAERLKGEVVDMKQETNKASSELLEGLDQVREVQAEIEQQLAKLYHNFELIVSKTKAEPGKAGVPLCVFLYGYKTTSCKPKKPSLFARIRPIFRKQNKRASRSMIKLSVNKLEDDSS